MTTEQADLQVVMVDDHLALRRGLELLLRADGMHVTGVSDNVAEARRLILDRRPDVAVVDIGLEDGSGLDLIADVFAESPAQKILLYTGAVDQDDLRAALSSGAQGLALKAGAPSEFVAAVRTIAAGGEYVDPRLAQLLATSEGESINVLSTREREILNLLADGLRSEEVAERLVLSPQTVQTHVRNLMRKLGAKTRVHALALALRQREIHPR